MESGTHRRRRRREPKDELLEATLVVIARRGVVGTQINEVAAVAGITPGGLLYHFGSRQGLLSEALRFKDQRWLALIDRAVESAETSTLDSTIAFLLDPSAESRATWHRDWTVWFESVVAAFHDNDVRDSVAAREARWIDLIARAMGDSNDPTIRAAAVALLSLIDGLAIRLLVAPADLTHAQAVIEARSFAHRLLSAVRSPT